MYDITKNEYFKKGCQVLFYAFGLCTIEIFLSQYLQPNEIPYLIAFLIAVPILMFAIWHVKPRGVKA